MIPKKIWHTYETKYELLPDNIKFFIESWISKYPDFEYNYMDCVDRENFVLEYFGKEWHDIFINLPHNIMRADIWRHMILYIHGGIYFDLDTMPIYKINDWLKDEYSMIVFGDESQENSFLFYYQVIASEPNNPITKSVIDYMFNQFKNSNYKNEDYKNVHYVFKYSAEPAFKKGIDLILDPDNHVDKNSHMVYNELDTAKKYKFYCYGNEYDIFDGKAFRNIDGANNWILGYNSWWKNAGYEGVWRKSNAE